MSRIILFLCISICSLAVFAGEAEDLANIQKQLNAEVMAKPFSVADEARVDAYIKNAMKKDLKPPVSPPSFWRPGYTCANLYGYAWHYYRDCRYHYRYYGRYWW